MFYPFGYILDGKIIASYQGDEGTVTTGDSRRRKEHQGTLQRKPVEQFAEVAFYAARENQGAQYNEAIVHTPKVRGVLIDEQELDRLTSFGAKKKKVFDLDKQVDVVAYHTLLSSLKKENIIRQQEGVPSSGDNKGKHMAIFALYWKTKVEFTPDKRTYRMFLGLSFVLIALFVWVAENIGTFYGAWQYPSQIHAWERVSYQKITSWFLMVIISFIVVSYLKHVKANRTANANGSA
jgi:hypothetical protein